MEVYRASENGKLIENLENIHSQQASTFLIQENNTDFKQLEVQCDWNNEMKSFWPHHHSTYSTSIAKSHTGRYLPGGTTTCIVGKQSSRVVNSGTGIASMGRFSWILLQGKAERKILLLSVYQSCQTKKTGPYTVHAQQSHILCQQGHTDPNPRRQCIKDLIKCINQQIQRGHEIIASIDVNEEMYKDNKKLWSKQT